MIEIKLLNYFKEMHFYPVTHESALIADTFHNESIEQRIIRLVSINLACSPDAIAISRVGGYTNSNFKVSCGEQSYFVKVGNPHGDILRLTIANEVICRSLLKDNYLTTPVLFFDPAAKIMITEFIEAKELNFVDGVIPHNFVEALRSLHHSNVRLPNDFCPFQIIQDYMKEIKQLGVLIPENTFEEILPKLYKLNGLLPVVEKVPCHLDPQFANVLVADDRIYFVDWESAGMADPFFDLASMSASEEFSDQEMYHLVAKYLGREPDEKEREHLFYLRILADMRMCLICFLQTKIRPQQDQMYRGFAEIFLQQCSKRLFAAGQDTTSGKGYPGQRP